MTNEKAYAVVFTELVDGQMVNSQWHFSEDDFREIMRHVKVHYGSPDRAWMVSMDDVLMVRNEMEGRVSSMVVVDKED